MRLILYDSDDSFTNLLDGMITVTRAETEESLLKDFQNFDACLLNPALLKITHKLVHKIIDKIPIILILDKQSNIEKVIDALSHGAFDYISKPPVNIMGDSEIKAVANSIVEKIKSAVDSTKLTVVRHDLDREYNFTRSSQKIIIIGSSTGGPQSLEQIIPLIPKEIPSPVIVVQHMPEDFTCKLADRLNSISMLEVKEAEDGETLKNGVCYVAKGNYHMELIKNMNNVQVSLNKKEKIHGTRPSIDITMKSATNCYGSNMIGVILTGMGNDGTIGAKKIKENGGTIIAQSEKTSVIFGMPKSVIKSGYYDEIVDLQKIPVAILQILEI